MLDVYEEILEDLTDDMYYVLKEDGTLGGNISGTWEKNGNKITITMLGNKAAVFTYRRGKLIATETKDGVVIKMIYERED